MRKEWVEIVDPKLVLSTFVAVFVAEMGDKTQLATFVIAGSASSRWSVFVGASLALVACSALATSAANLARFIPFDLLQRVIGVSFIVIGVVYVFDLDIKEMIVGLFRS